MEIKAYKDIFVKYLLGNPGHEDILLRFINDVLSDSSFKPIQSVEVKNPFNFQEFNEDKLSILDVKAVDESERIYNIEIQAQGDESHKSRILYYWAKCYSSQLSEGESYEKLKPVISINLLNFDLIKESKDIHSWFSLCKNGNTDLVLTDHLMIHFLELSKYQLSREIKKIDKWLYYFKYEGERDMKIIIKDDEVLDKAHRVYKNFSQDDRLRELYESRLEAERRYISDIEIAEKKGKKEGKLEIAKNMLGKGLDLNLISEISGLSLEELKKLKDK